MRQYSEHFYDNETCPLSMSVVILIAVDTLSNTAESEKKKLIDDPDLDVTYHYLREYYSLGNAINKPRGWSRAIVCVNGKPIL